MLLRNVNNIALSLVYRYQVFRLIFFLDHSINSSKGVPLGKNSITPMFFRRGISFLSKNPPAVTVI